MLYYANRYARTFDTKYTNIHRADSLTHACTYETCNYTRDFGDILFKVEEIVHKIHRITPLTKDQKSAVYIFFLRAAISPLFKAIDKDAKRIPDGWKKEVEAAFGKSSLYIETFLNLLLSLRE